MDARWVSSEKPAVILNGVSPRAKAGAKRSEESLTVTRAEAEGVMAHASHQTASAHRESAILHCVRVADSRNSVQDDGGFLRLTPDPR